MEGSSTADEFLTDIDRAGRNLNEIPADINALDDMEKRKTRPTIGWMQRHTQGRS